MIKTAAIILPTTSWIEMDGTFINNEGRAQRFKKVMTPGLPIRGVNPELHPPREHRKTVPGGEPRPAWQIVADLISRANGDQIHEPLLDEWQILRELDTEGKGFRVLPP
jgi:NADH-quinone oxidoreductase subunit G